MALASGAPIYTPPKAVAELERRNALFPICYSSPGDAVLVRFDDIADDIQPAGIRIIRPDDLSGCDEEISPWGWNIALRNELSRYGYSTDRMPSIEALEAWRELAHRRTAATLCRLADFSHCALEFFDAEAALCQLSDWGKGVIKMPWSSSGRGVMTVTTADYVKAEARIKQTIARQGSVMLEPLHDKCTDFATEWESDGKNIRFLGFSAFSTDGGVRYMGNLAASRDVVLDRISNGDASVRGSVEDLQHSLVDVLEEVLIKRCAFPFVGLFGVDGLVTSSGSVVECLEINLRRTMGHVALDVYSATGKESVVRIF